MKFCTNCGAQLQDNAKFCGNCGTPVQQSAEQPTTIRQQQPVGPPPVQQAPQPQPQQASPQQPGKSVTLCPDGKYRWTYEVNMFRNTAILETVLKIFGGIILGMWLLDLIFSGFEDVWAVTKVMFFIFLGLIVLSLLGYLVVAAMYGGKYCVLFEMDNEGVSHAQLPKQFKKAQVMGFIAALASGNPTTAGAGILAASRNSLYTAFGKVRTIKPLPGQHLIKVNAPLSKNQVYVEDQDFQFVLDFIRSHCPKAQ